MSDRYLIAFQKNFACRQGFYFCICFFVFFFNITSHEKFLSAEGTRYPMLSWYLTEPKGGILCSVLKKLLGSTWLFTMTNISKLSSMDWTSEGPSPSFQIACSSINPMNCEIKVYLWNILVEWICLLASSMSFTFHLTGQRMLYRFPLLQGKAIWMSGRMFILPLIGSIIMLGTSAFQCILHACWRAISSMGRFIKLDLVKWLLRNCSSQSRRTSMVCLLGGQQNIGLT